MDYRVIKFLLKIIIFMCVNLYVESYQIGVGRADCTGPPTEINFMGYGTFNQKGEGIHMRQFCRTFIVADDKKRVILTSVEGGMIGHAIKRDVVVLLQSKFGSIYSIDNIAISGTHTHSAPGGFLMDLLYDLSCLGFSRETYNAYVSGIFKSIVQAHNSMIDGKIFLSKTEVEGANINRSPLSYLNNPLEERNKYTGDTDKTLLQLKFVETSSNTIIGAFNWFSVHATSMNNTNRLVSSDNLGYAAMLLENKMNPKALIGKGKYVAAMVSTYSGDVSPNIEGPKCTKTGKPCDTLTSSCAVGDGLCIASGPGKDIMESTYIIGQRIYKASANLLDAVKGKEVTGDIDFMHQFVDMPKVSTTYLDPFTKENKNIQGCVPAMGYSFAAGTTDGPGAFDFKQGTLSDNVLWNSVRDFIAHPTQEDIDCHHPKPILMATGRAKFPYEWQPKIIPTQILKIGNVILAPVPGEFTTMSGRRLSNALKSTALQFGFKNDIEVIVTGLSNMYSSYITTPEEYLVQRYEGASTLFGPNTLPIYTIIYEGLLKAILKKEQISPGPYPPRLDDDQLSFITPVVFDGHPFGRDFGEVLIQPFQSYRLGETARATFVGANPRNNIMHDSTYFTIDMLMDDNTWKIIATDANWETMFKWKRTSTILGFSNFEVSWTINDDTIPGTYRITYSGFYRFILGGKYPFSGTSRSFNIQ